MKLVILLSLIMVLGACGKTVTKKKDSSLTNSSTSGIIVNDQPVNSLPTDGSNFEIKTMDLVFSNFGEIGSSDEIPTIITNSDTSKLMEYPQEISSISFKNESLHPNLSFFLNNEFVCGYTWVNSSYKKHSSCISKIMLEVNDKIVLKGVPQGQTVLVSISYQQ